MAANGGEEASFDSFIEPCGLILQVQPAAAAGTLHVQMGFVVHVYFSLVTLIWYYCRRVLLYRSHKPLVCILDISLYNISTVFFIMLQNFIAKWLKPECPALASLLAATDSLALPKNPLDDVIDALGGPNRVAELTGRSKRFVKTANGSYKCAARRLALRFTRCWKRRKLLRNARPCDHRMRLPVGKCQPCGSTSAAQCVRVSVINLRRHKPHVHPRTSCNSNVTDPPIPSRPPLGTFPARRAAAAASTRSTSRRGTPSRAAASASPSSATRRQLVSACRWGGVRIVA